MRFAGGYAIVLAAILAGLLVYAASLRYAPPEPLPATGPTEQFSGARAHATLERVLQGTTPHPAGSDEATAVRERILKELADAGIAARVQRGFACSGWSCAFVSNVVGELKGTTEEAVLLASHYDSVPAGPGAGDDGAGVAVLLEVARALRAAAREGRSVLFLFDEGEEDGLLGARAFVTDPDFARVRAVVNVDARGNGGPALLFETNAANAVVVRAIAAKLPRPLTSSALAPLASLMPNGTDFTVFKQASPALLGANLALLGDIGTYHTPLDVTASVSPGSLQAAGDGVLGLARAFAEGAPSGPERVAWFDVLGLAVVRWPVAWSTALACAALALVVLATALRFRRKRVTPMELVRGIGALPLMLACTTAVSVSLTSTLMSSGVLPAAWTANGPLAMAAMWATGLALAGAAAAALGRDLGEGLFCGIWGTLGVAGLALSLASPDLSYLVVFPTLVAGAVGVATAWSTRDDVGDGALLCAALLPGLALVVVAAPLLLLLYAAMGLQSAPAGALLGGAVALTFAPAYALATPHVRWTVPGVLVIAALALTALTARAPAFTEASPARANVIFAEDERTARASVDMQWGRHEFGTVPAPMRTALGIATEAQRLPWSPGLVLGADFPRAGLAAPDAEVLGTSEEGAQRRIRLKLRSPRDARTLSLLLPPGTQARFARANGLDLGPATDTIAWRELRIVGVPREGVDVEVLATRDPLTVTIADETAGLPPSAVRIAAARPANAVPAQRGDCTIVSRQRAIP